jgi:DNA-binding MarR family transcriptional regulator
MELECETRVGNLVPKLQPAITISQAVFLADSTAPGIQCILDLMPQDRSAPDKRKPQEKRALRFLQVMEALMAREMRLRRDDLFTSLDLTFSEFRGFIWLFQHGRTVMSAFAEGIDVPLSTATRIVNRLVKKDFVVRHRSDLDRRIVEVDLSPTAYKLGQRLRAKRLASYERILAPLNSSESEAVVALIEKGFRLSGPPEEQAFLTPPANSTK